MKNIILATVFVLSLAFSLHAADVTNFLLPQPASLSQSSSQANSVDQRLAKVDYKLSMIEKALESQPGAVVEGEPVISTPGSNTAVGVQSGGLYDTAPKEILVRQSNGSLKATGATTGIAQPAVRQAHGPSGRFGYNVGDEDPENGAIVTGVGDYQSVPQPQPYTQPAYAPQPMPQAMPFAAPQPAYTSLYDPGPSCVGCSGPGCVGGACMGGACVGGNCAGGTCIGGSCMGGTCAGGSCGAGGCPGGNCGASGGFRPFGGFFRR